jgi:hypothetical protein
MMGYKKYLLLFFIFVSAYGQDEDFSPTYIPPNINNPYNTEANPYEKELQELERNIQSDIQQQQEELEQNHNSKNSWFYDIFKSLKDLF